MAAGSVGTSRRPEPGDSKALQYLSEPQSLISLARRRRSRRPILLRPSALQQIHGLKIGSGLLHAEFPGAARSVERAYLTAHMLDCDHQSDQEQSLRNPES